MFRKKILLPLIVAAAAIFGAVAGRISALVSQSDASPILNSISLGQGSAQNKLQTVLSLISSQYVDDVSVDSLVEDVIPQVLEQLDPHSAYIPPQDMKKVSRELEANFGGIGVMYDIMHDTVTIMSVVEGGPSSVIGIRPGDKLIRVNGHDFTGKWLNYDVVIDSLRGQIGTVVDLSVLRGGNEYEYQIKRGLIPNRSVQVSYMIKPNVGYMKIDRFAESTYNEMMMGIAKLKSQGCADLIIDLRSNTGGFMDQALNMCDEFLQKGDLIVYTEGARQPRQDCKASGRGNFIDMGLVVLVDEYSASASEIFAGAVQDNDRGLVVGRRTFGKGLVQQQIPFGDNSAIRLTVSRYHTPSGRCIQRPYDKGLEDYYSDGAKRYLSGELFSSDSVKFDQSQQFRTKNGRTVYGGGGIMPDIFVPRDTSRVSDYLYKLRVKDLVRDFAADYAFARTDSYAAMTIEQFVDDISKADVVPALMAYAEKHGVARPAKGQKIDIDNIALEARAAIARNAKGYEAVMMLHNKTDEMVARALQEIAQNTEGK